MLYAHRKKILIIFMVYLVVIGCGIGVYIYRKANRVLPNDTPAQQAPSEAVRNIDTIPAPTAMKNAVIRYTQGVLEASYGKATYTPTLREGSFVHTETAESITLSTLIDVPEKKVTYLYTQVTSTRNPNSGTSYIRCAPADQQMSQPSTCKDIAND